MIKRESHYRFRMQFGLHNHILTKSVLLQLRNLTKFRTFATQQDVEMLLLLLFCQVDWIILIHFKLS